MKVSKYINLFLILLVFLLIQVFSSYSNQYYTIVDSMLNFSIDKNLAKQQRISKNISSRISKGDTLVVLDRYRYWIKKSETINELLLCHSYFYYTRELMSYKLYDEFIKNWDIGFKLSEDNDLIFEQADYFALKSEYFKRIKKFDSVFVYTLKAEILFSKLGDIDKIVTVNTLLADSYYQLELFESAEELYRKIYDLKGGFKYWNRYRKFTTLNNLGLIKLEQDSAEKALQYFKMGLSHQESLIKNDTSKGFLLRLAYSKLMIAKCLLEMGQLESSLNHFYSSYQILNRIKGLESFNDFYSIGAEIYLGLNKLDSIDDFLSKAEQIQFLNNDKKNLIQTYKLWALYHYKKGNSSQSEMYLRKSLELFEKRNKELGLNKVILIKVENDEKLYNERLVEKEQRIKNLIYVVVIISILLIIIAYFYAKRIIQNKLLVKKSYDIVKNERLLLSYQKQDSHFNDNKFVEFEEIKDEDLKEEPIQNDNNDFIELAQKIDFIIRDEKLYLNKELSINDISQILKINRTYISKAINNHLSDNNFKDYINELRIKESMILLSNPDNDKFTLETIYEKCGFNSRNSFNRAFLKFTGVTPSFYQKTRKP